MQRGKVKGRNLSPNGRIIGICNDNSVLNSLARDVEVEDGNVREHVAKVIGETC